MNKKQLADAYIDYINTISNVLQSVENMLNLVESSELKGLSGPEIWELSSKKISLEQLRWDAGFLEEFSKSNQI